MTRTGPKTYGYKRRRDVPVLEGRTIRPCSRCDLWFAARLRERACDGCLRPAERARRAATHTEVPATALGVEKGQVAGSYSEILGLTFKPGVPPYMQLAIEAAALLKWSKKK